MESEPVDEDDVSRDFLDEDGIRDILDTMATDFECPSESEASDLGSDDELDDKPITMQEKEDLQRFLFDEFSNRIHPVKDQGRLSSTN